VIGLAILASIAIAYASEPHKGALVWYPGVHPYQPVSVGIRFIIPQKPDMNLFLIL
jgi:hypothetical protein